MALVVETGAGLVNAESYCSVPDATDYHTKRGNIAWGVLTQPDQEIHLRRATDYIEQVYSEAWKGYRAVSGQALSWPRRGVYIYNGSDSAYNGDYGAVIYTTIPVAVRNACAELALRSQDGLLLPDASEVEVIVSEKTGPLNTVFGKSKGPRFPAVSAMLRPYLLNSSSIRVIRV